MISSEELIEILNDIESARVERTISINNTDKFGEAICAFANDLPNYQKTGYKLGAANLHLLPRCFLRKTIHG